MVMFRSFHKENIFKGYFMQRQELKLLNWEGSSKMQKEDESSKASVIFSATWEHWERLSCK